MLFTEEDVQAVRSSILDDSNPRHVKTEILAQIEELRKLACVQEMAARSILTDMIGLVKSDHDIIEMRMADLVTAMALGYYVGKRQAELEILERMK